MEAQDIWKACADEAIENRRKLMINHLQTLESSLNEWKRTRITVSKLKIDLIKSYPELDGILDFCIRDTLRNRLSYSFKNREKASNLSTESGRIRMFTSKQRWCWPCFKGRLRQFFLRNFQIKAGFDSFLQMSHARIP